MSWLAIVKIALKFDLQIWTRLVGRDIRTKRLPGVCAGIFGRFLLPNVPRWLPPGKKKPKPRKISGVPSWCFNRPTRRTCSQLSPFPFLSSAGLPPSPFGQLAICTRVFSSRRHQYPEWDSVWCFESRLIFFLQNASKEVLIVLQLSSRTLNITHDLLTPNE